MPYEPQRFPYDGAVDADGHVLEPPDLWQSYLEARYRDRAIRIKDDDEGWQYLEIDGAPAEGLPKGILGVLGAFAEPDFRPSRDRRYSEHMSYGAGDPVERVDLLDKENLAGAILYPTIGLTWERDVTDPELTNAYMRAYNRWIADFCRDSGGRLTPIAQLSLLDVEEAAAELERAVNDGCKGGFLGPYSHTRKAHGHPDHDPLWAKAQELDVPVAIHPTLKPDEIRPSRRFVDFGEGERWFGNVFERQLIEHVFVSMFATLTIDRFPRLKLGILESGAGWIGSLLDRMDSAMPFYRTMVPLRQLPSEYFRQQCFISADPDETAAPMIVERVGADRFPLGNRLPASRSHGLMAGWSRALRRAPQRQRPGQSARAECRGYLQPRHRPEVTANATTRIAGTRPAIGGIARPRALITASFCGPGLEKLEDLVDVVLDPWMDHRPLRWYSEEELAERLRVENASIVICETDRCAGPVFDLPLVAVCVVRDEPANVDLAQATAAGVPVLHAPGRMADATAEFTLALLLAASRWVVPGRS